MHQWSYRTRRWRHRRRAVSPVLATIFLVAITVILVAVLYSYLSVSLPSQNPNLSFIAQGYQTQQAWGDPTDCTNTSNNAKCNNLPAVFMIITSHSPDSIALQNLQFFLYCNGTSLLNGTFKSLELIPGTGGSPNASSPTLGKCGTWSPSKIGNHATYFNRLAYFQQLNPGKTSLQSGDLFVIYAHPPRDFCDRNGYCPDDDFHGAPLWCFSVPGDCYVSLYDTAGTGAVVGQLQLYGLAPG